MLWDVFSDKTFQNTNTFQLNLLHKSGVKLLKKPQKFENPNLEFAPQKRSETFKKKTNLELIHDSGAKL